MYHRILILNWRDVRNPSSGGAEVLTHEVAKRWVALGNKVTQFSSNFDGALVKEEIDGVNIVRGGNPDTRYLFKSVHFQAFLYYLKHRHEFDILIDEVHGLPFFTPLYTRKRKVVLICEVAGKIWDTNFPFPFNKIGKFVERNYFRFYKKIPFLTISPSTQKDLEHFGVSKKNITVLPMGISLPKKLPNLKKEKNPTLIFVGRIIKAKGVEDAIEVCNLLKEDFPSIKLWIIGRGEKNYENEIKNKIKKRSLSKNIAFLEFLPQEEKFKMIQKAHVLLAPSIKEGFGLTVPEAGIVGTPAIAYNVEGLKDIIQHMKNGIIVDISPIEMASAVRKMLLNRELYIKIQRGALNFARRLNWDNTAKEALKIIES